MLKVISSTGETEIVSDRGDDTVSEGRLTWYLRNRATSEYADQVWEWWTAGAEQPLTLPNGTETDTWVWSSDAKWEAKTAVPGVVRLDANDVVAVVTPGGEWIYIRPSASLDQAPSFELWNGEKENGGALVTPPTEMY